MKPQQMANKIMRGLRPKHSLRDLEYSAQFLGVVADALCRAWKDPSKHEIAFELLSEGLKNGTLALLAQGDEIILLDAKSGEYRVRVPMADLNLID